MFAEGRHRSGRGRSGQRAQVTAGRRLFGLDRWRSAVLAAEACGPAVGHSLAGKCPLGFAVNLKVRCSFLT